MTRIATEEETPHKNASAEEELADSFYEEDEEQPKKKRKREKKPFSLIGNLIFILTILILLAIGWAV